MRKSPEQNEVRAQLKEAWDRAREMIKNENELINQRLSWMFAAQGFLFAALAVVAKTAAETVDWWGRVLTACLLLPIMIVGFFSSLAAYRMARDANAQREFAAGYWQLRSKNLLGSVKDEEFREKIFSHGFPERVHGVDLGTNDFGLLRLAPGARRLTRDHTFPKVMSWAWVVVSVVWVVFMVSVVAARPAPLARAQATLHDFMAARIDRQDALALGLVSGSLRTDFTSGLVQAHVFPLGNRCWYRYELLSLQEPSTYSAKARVRVYEHFWGGDTTGGPPSSWEQEISLVNTVAGWKVEQLGPLENQHEEPNEPHGPTTSACDVGRQRRG